MSSPLIAKAYKGAIYSPEYLFPKGDLCVDSQEREGYFNE
jgi:hypothetical protein